MRHILLYIYSELHVLFIYGQFDLQETANDWFECILRTVQKSVF